MITPAVAGPTMRARLNDAELRATALGSMAFGTISLTNAWRAGVSNAAAGAEQERQHVHVPGLHPAEHGEHTEHCCRAPHGELGHHQHAALREAVGDHAGDGGEQQDRQELQTGRDAERPGAAGQREDEPVLGDALHPGADVRHQRAGGEQAVVAIAEGGEGAVVADAVDQPTSRSAAAHDWASRSSSGAAANNTSRSASSSSSITCDASHAVRRLRSRVSTWTAASVSPDDHLASVRLVRPPRHQLHVDQRVDRARHRRRLDVLGRGQLADGGVAESFERRQRRQLGERQVAVVALEAQPPGEAHHADAQVAHLFGGIGDRSLVAVESRWNGRSQGL